MPCRSLRGSVSDEIASRGGKEWLGVSVNAFLPACNSPAPWQGHRGSWLCWGHMGEGACSSCLGGSERILARGALRCVSLSAIWPFQGDVLIFASPVSQQHPRVRSQSAGGCLSLPCQGSCTPGRGESRSKPGMSQGRRVGSESEIQEPLGSTSCSRHRAAPTRGGRLLGKREQTTKAQHTGWGHQCRVDAAVLSSAHKSPVCLPHRCLLWP